MAGEYELEFTYRVGDQAANDTATVYATTENLAPIVKAGTRGDGPFLVDAQVTLEGGASYDPNRDDELSYQWRIVDSPERSQFRPGTVATFEGATFATATSKLSGAGYFLFFAALMLIAAFLFIPVAYFYKEKVYIQDSDPEEDDDPSAR